MRLFERNQPEKPIRKRKAKSNSWLRNQVKNSAELLDSLKETSPMLKAAIVSKAIGKPFTKEDIVIKTPQQLIEEKVAEAALKDVVADPDFVESYKDAILEGMYAKAGAAGRCRRRRSEDDGSDGEFLPGGYGNGPMPPLQMVEEVDELKERV
jgi:hypothetical protein